MTNPILDWLLPKRCVLCDDMVYELSICDSCRSLINIYPNPMSGEKRAIISLFYYESAMKDLIKQAKFNKELVSTRLLLHLAMGQLYDSGLLSELEQAKFSAVTFVPTSWLRRVQRGCYLPAMFSLMLAKSLNINVYDLLGRKSLIKRQTLLKNKSDRKEAVKEAFLLKKNEMRFRNILLVDDIVTTGSTFDECRKILNPISKKIRCLSIAKTP